MIDYIFDNNPKFLLIDEIDKMASKDQTFLLNLMETGIVSETKRRKTRTIRSVKTWVFATSNNISKVMLPLQSRLFVVKLATANAIGDKSGTSEFFNYKEKYAETK